MPVAIAVTGVLASILAFTWDVQKNQSRLQSLFNLESQYLTTHFQHGFTAHANIFELLLKDWPGQEGALQLVQSISGNAQGVEIALIDNATLDVEGNALEITEDAMLRMRARTPEQNHTLSYSVPLNAFFQTPVDVKTSAVDVVFYLDDPTQPVYPTKLRGIAPRELALDRALRMFPYARSQPMHVAGTPLTMLALPAPAYLAQAVQISSWSILVLCLTVTALFSWAAFRVVNERNRISEEVAKQTHALTSSRRSLKSRNSELEQLIYSMSHDLRAPLVTISGFAKMLLESETWSNPDSLHKMRRIADNATHLDNMLADLLALSRVSREELAFEVLDVEQILSRVRSSLESQILTAGANIELEIEPGHLIRGNASLCYTALQNLISNAIKYRKPGQPLEIKVRAQGTSISVEDNGLGIDPRFHESIFGLFEQLDKSEGNGVGLAIVKAIMEKHQGSVSVASSVQQGSVFTLRFAA